MAKVGQQGELGGARGSQVETNVPRGISRRVTATLREAAEAGLTAGSRGWRISARIQERLLQAASQQSGLQGSDLIEYALAKVALEDDFGEKLLARDGKVGREIDLEL